MKHARIWTTFILTMFGVGSLGTSRPRSKNPVRVTHCPQNFDEAVHATGPCTREDGAADIHSCPYPEGTCTCVGGAICGGNGARVPSVFRCVSTTWKRDDGCYYAPPVNGAECAEWDTQCVYPIDRCGSEILRATCIASKWTVTHEQIPRPP